MGQNDSYDSVNILKVNEHKFLTFIPKTFIK